MKSLHSHTDRLASLAASSALLSLAPGQIEQMRAVGVYDVVNRAPVAHLVNEFRELRDQIVLLDRAHAFAPADELRRQLEAIPQEIVWKDRAVNLVTTVGKNDMLNNHLSGSAYTAAWFLGLMSATSYTTGPNVADTAASHTGWTEATGYTAATRPAASWAAASAGSKPLTAGVVFSINAAATIKGCILINNSTKGGTTGTLFSAGLFAGGDQPVVDTNTLTANYVLSV